jgi:transcriptional regulator of acetoin/glycerol metabolism
MNASQQLRFTALANDHAAVSVVHLPEGLGLLARDEDGAVVVVEVLDGDGRTVRIDEALRITGAARQQAARTLEQSTDLAIALVALDEDTPRNLAETARELGMSRTTLYARLDALQIAEPANAKSAKR